MTIYSFKLVERPRATGYHFFRWKIIVFAVNKLITFSSQIAEQLKVRQHDPEESVRHDVVNSILMVAKKDMNALSPELIQFIKERTLDKRVLCLLSNFNDVHFYV